MRKKGTKLGAYLKTGRLLLVRRIERLESAFDLHFGKQSEDGLDYQIVNCRFYPFYIDAFALHIAEYARQFAFASLARRDRLLTAGRRSFAQIGALRGKLVRLVLLVQRVIRQMHVDFVQIVLVGRLVVDCGKAHQTLVTNVNLERFETHDYHVDSQVELEAIDKKRIVNVLLYNVDLGGVARLGHGLDVLVGTLDEHDAIALTAIVRLDYERARVLLELALTLVNKATVLTELFELLGQEPSARIKVELF